jgi:muramoyltetrapeptide carboxypeptidase
MHKPRALRPGDHIRIVSPASPLKPEQTERAVALLEGEGYRVSFGAHAYDQTGFLAGKDEDRAVDLQDAFADPDVAAVLCSRGGYGCARLLDHLNLDAMAASGKMFGGFSDITTLHLALNRRGLVTFHMPMLLSFSVDREPWVVESFLALLKGGNPIPADAKRGETIRAGQADGVLTGGCLCLLTDSLATPNALDAEGKILLIEDVDENPHRIDAMLTHLRNAGVLQEAAGLVFGEMTGTDERFDEKIGSGSWRDIVLDRVSDLSMPMILDYPFGHMKTMLSLPLGVRAQLDADAGMLRLVEPPCED